MANIGAIYAFRPPLEIREEERRDVESRATENWDEGGWSEQFTFTAEDEEEAEIWGNAIRSLTDRARNMRG